MSMRGFEKVFSAITLGWLVTTTFTQHPNRSFDRLRALDRYTIVIPNWRFFAPNPATHDFIFGVRYRLEGQKEVSDWEQINETSERRVLHILFHPKRRVEKSLSDICGRVLEGLGRYPERLAHTADYKVLVERARKYIAQNVSENVDKFQMLIAADAGFDREEAITEYYISPGIEFGAE